MSLADEFRLADELIDAQRARRLVLKGVLTVVEIRVVALDEADRPPVELDDEGFDRDAVDGLGDARQLRLLVAPPRRDMRFGEPAGKERHVLVRQRAEFVAGGHIGS